MDNDGIAFQNGLQRKLTIKQLASKDELGVVKERHELGGGVGCCFDV